MPLTATELLNDATTREIGGVGPDQVNLIVATPLFPSAALNCDPKAWLLSLK